MPHRFDSRFVRTKPERPYRTLADYRAKVIGWGSRRKFFDRTPNAWPCTRCRGDGRIYDPNDPPDPVEGNRHRDVIDCTACNGTGCIGRELFAATYREIISKYLHDKEEYETLVKAKKVAIAKLSDLELRALRELGI